MKKSKILIPLALLLLCLLLPLALAGCGGKVSAEQNAVTSVTLDEKGIITVKAALTKGFLESYTEKRVYLFEIPSRYSTDADLEELDPVAEVKPKASISVTVPAADGVRSRLYSSFLVASYDPATRRYTPLTTPMAISNPEAAAAGTPSETEAENSIKGLISDYPADAIRLGISHTVVEVPMDRLILGSWREGAVSYIHNGTTAYLDSEALAELDEKVGIYTAAGVRVYLRFTLRAPSEDSVAPSGIYRTASPAEGEAPYCAVNMSSAFSAEIMEGFFGFMAKRYADPEYSTRPVTAFIVGYRVNSAADCDGGGDSLAAFVTNYEKLVRVAHVAIKSRNPDGQVYIALDSHRSAQAMAGGWDVPTFLAAFREECALRGDYDWQISCELYADSREVWVENPVTDSNRFTVHSLSTLTDILSGDKYRTPDGQERRVLISGFTLPAVSVGGSPDDTAALNLQAASYAYAYMTCVQNRRIEALIYSEYADTATAADSAPLCGLLSSEAVTVDTAGGPILRILPAKHRPICDVFKIMDTTEAQSLSAALSAVIGASYTKLESALAGVANPVTSVKGSGHLKPYEEEHKKSSVLFAFDGGTLHGFESAGNLTYLELASAESLGTVSLYARFDREAPSDPMGLSVTLPATQLIGGRELLFDLFAGPMAFENASAHKPTLTLRLTREAKGAVADGEGELLYEASVSELKGSNWQTAVFDISSFTDLLDASDEVTLTLLMDDPDSDGAVTAYGMGIAAIHVTGNTATSGNSTVTAVAILSVLALMVIAAFVFVLVKHLRKKPLRKKP